MRFSTITTIALVGSAYAAPALDITRREANLARDPKADIINDAVRKMFMGFEKRDVKELMARDPESGFAEWASEVAKTWYLGF
ncbi:hypothetical protein BST61_g2580 [Cercospora zeina]